MIMELLIPKRKDVANLIQTCTKLADALHDHFYKAQFRDRELGPALLSWACLQDRKTLVDFLFSGAGCIVKVDINKPTETTFGRARYRFDEYDSLSEQARQKMPLSWLIPHFPVQRGGWGYKPTELSPLGFAVMAQNLEITQMLIDHGANIEQRDNQGRTPLFFAVTEDMVALLLRVGANPLHMASDNRDIPLAAYLKGPVLWNHAKGMPTKSLAAFRLLLAATMKMDPNWSITVDTRMGHRQRPQETLLQMAIIDQEMEYIRLILEAGADPNNTHGLRESSRPLPIQMAIQRPDPEALAITKLLITFGADVNLISHTRNVSHSALTCAVSLKKYDMVRWLIEECGADPNMIITSCSDLTWYEQLAGGLYETVKSPIREAIRDKNIEMLRLLISLGAKVRHDDLSLVMNTLCWSSCNFVQKWFPSDQVMWCEFVRVLVENGADVYNHGSRTSYFVDDIRTFLNRGRSFDFYSNQGPDGVNSVKHLTLYGTNHRAAQYKFEPVLDRMLYIYYSEGGSGVPAARTKEVDLGRGPREVELRLYQHHRTWTYLHDAMTRGGRTSVKVLLDGGVDPNCNLRLSSQMRNTPLGVVIRLRNYVFLPHPYEASGIRGPWPGYIWGNVEALLSHHGPELTANFPTGLMAEFLSQAVARLRNDKRMKKRVRQFARLTNHNGRWGPDGFSGLLDLVRHPGFWYSFERRSAFYNKEFVYRKTYVETWPVEEPSRKIWKNLLRASRMIWSLSGESSRRLVTEESEGPWFITRWWDGLDPRAERSTYISPSDEFLSNFFPPLFREASSHQARLQPPLLPDDEYQTCFSILFGEQDE